MTNLLQNIFEIMETTPARIFWDYGADAREIIEQLAAIEKGWAE